MKKVITALLNKTVNEKLKQYDEIKILMNDIQYQDGIIEALEINNEINFIILSELLPGEYSLKGLVEKIKEIKKEIEIIIILEKENKELENYLYAKGNIHIFYNNQIEIKEIAKLIINKNKNEELEKQIKQLKEIILNSKEENNNKENQKMKLNTIIEEERENINIKEEEKIKIEKEIEYEYLQNLNKNNLINKIINLFIKNKNKKECKTIIISGIAGVGKSVFTINLSKALKKQKNKILIIDFDFLNNSILTLFGIKNKKRKSINIEKNYEEKLDKNFINTNDEEIINQNFYNNENKKIEIENLIIKINSNINLISNINLLFSDNKINDLELLKIINKIKTNYDFILIDLNIEEQFYLEFLFNHSDKIIFLTESNILSIKKSKNILEKYINKFKIQKNKIYIIFNKEKSDSICFYITKEFFKKYNILGKINFIKNYNLLMNQKMKEIYIENKIKKQYLEIAKKLSKNNLIKQYYIDKISH